MGTASLAFSMHPLPLCVLWPPPSQPQDLRVAVLGLLTPLSPSARVLGRTWTLVRFLLPYMRPAAWGAVPLAHSAAWPPAPLQGTK